MWVFLIPGAISITAYVIIVILRHRESSDS